MRYLLCILIALSVIGDSEAGQILRGSTTGGGGSYATPAHVGSSVSVYDGGCSTNASKSVTAGNTLVMSVSGAGTQVLTGVSTYTGTTSAWTHLGTGTLGDVDVSFYAATVTTTGTVAARPTCTTSADAGYVMAEYSGVKATSPQIGTIQYDGSSSAASFATANITVSTPALLVGMWASETANKVITWGSGWTERAADTSHYHRTADKVVTASGDYNLSGSFTGATDFNTAFVALEAAAL